VEEVCYSFPDPLNNPRYAFLALDEGDLRRINFQEELSLEITK